LILRAYQRWGSDCPERLLGDFSFVIWDAARRALFCVCDRFAVKPLFWHRSPHVWAASTEIKALLALDEVPRRLNELRFADVLTLYLDDPTSTAYADVARLPAAHALTIDHRGARLRRYWRLDGERELGLRTDAEYEEVFRSTFRDAVGSRLRSRRPVAAALSGGLDSSSIVVMARHLLASGPHGSPPLRTISASFTTAHRADEREYIDAVVGLGGLESHFVTPETYGPLDDWPGAAWRGDEPEFVMQVTIARAVYTRAAELGSDCVLEGEGGDEVVSNGLGLLTELARRGRWAKLIREARSYAERAGFSGGTAALLREYAVSPFLPRGLWMIRQRMRRTAAGTAHWASGIPLNPDFIQRLGLEARYELKAEGERHSINPRRENAEWLMSPEFTITFSLDDRMGGVLGVEPRYPFLDSRLAELCVAVPQDQVLRQGYRRDIVRRAMGELLPSKVRLRPQKGRPGAHTGYTLPATGREVMDSVLLDGPGPIANYVDIDAIRHQYRRCLTSTDANQWYPVWRVVVGALWLSQAMQRHGLYID
jgi:asparagine synthase (glutamine-hydrolysing)